MASSSNRAERDRINRMITRQREFLQETITEIDEKILHLTQETSTLTSSVHQLEEGNGNGENGDQIRTIQDIIEEKDSSIEKNRRMKRDFKMVVEARITDLVQEMAALNCT